LKAAYRSPRVVTTQIKKNECNTYECKEVVSTDNQPIGCQKITRACANLGAIVGAAVGAGAAVGIALGVAFLCLVAVAGGTVCSCTSIYTRK